MTFLFDIGRVLLDFDFETSLVTLLPAGDGDPRERLLPLLERKDAFEAGQIEEAVFIAWALECMGSSATVEDFRHAWRNIFTPNEPMWKVVDRLVEAGHRLILFSNINAIHSPWIFETYPGFARFHGAVQSFEVGAIKADPVIYRHAIEKYGLDPEETRYIDDLPANIATGKQLGFRCWLYDLKDHAAFEKWLDSELARG